MQQYFIEEELHENTSIPIPEHYQHHLFRVLRMKNDQLVHLVDSQQKVFIAKIDGSFFNVEHRIICERELMTKVTAIIALTKADKFELALQKLVELGVYQIVGLETKRCVVKVYDVAKKIARWNKIILDAAKQCKRTIVPKFVGVITLKEIDFYKSKQNIVAYEAEVKHSLALNNIESISFVIGPEGGFETEEIELLQSKGFEPTSLGKRILRAETAAIFLMSVIAYQMESEQ